MKLFSCLVLFAVVCGNFACTPVPEVHDEKGFELFETPHIVKPAKVAKITLFDVDSIQSSWAFYMGRYKFSDTIRIKGEYGLKGASELIPRSPCNDNYDHLKNDGLQIVVDYNSSIAKEDSDYREGHYYYPLFVVNETMREKHFMPVVDGGVVAIQEALDSNGRWRPINYAEGSSCSDTDHFNSFSLNANEFALILLPKYTGLYKTRIRVRILIGNDVYVSESFEASMNPSQFLLEKRGLVHYHMTAHPEIAIPQMFLGSIPLEADPMIRVPTSF